MSTFQGYCKLSSGLESNFSELGRAAISQSTLGMSSEAERTMLQDKPADSSKSNKGVNDSNSLGGRVMLIDGTSVMYRAYYKLIGML